MGQRHLSISWFGLKPLRRQRNAVIQVLLIFGVVDEPHGGGGGPVLLDPKRQPIFPERRGSIQLPLRHRGLAGSESVGSELGFRVWGGSDDGRRRGAIRADEERRRRGGEQES